MPTQRATSNVTAHGLLASLTTNISYTGRNILQKAVDLILRGLQTCLQWIAYWSCQAIATVWRALKSSHTLQAIFLILLRIFKWCSIALATAIGVTVIIHIGYWGLPKLLKIYNESRVRRLEDRRQNEERKRRAVYLSELRARQAAEATAMKEARLQRAREDQVIKDKLKRDEEQRRIKARAGYMNWEEECDRFFRDKASMAKLPFPPLSRCTHTDCPRFLKYPVAACEHNVKQFFIGSGNDLLKVVKRQRLLWHEDRFASCPEALRPEFRRLANSLFVVLDPW